MLIQSVICKSVSLIFTLSVPDMSVKIGIPWVPLSWCDSFYLKHLSCDRWYAFFFPSVSRASLH